jgi:hypothetical protein
MTAPQFPASYVNTAVERALADLAAAPGERTLAALLDAAQRGGLVLDITGSDPESPHVRTIASTDGRPVLPLFTSMEQLEIAVGQALALAQDADGQASGAQAAGAQHEGTAVQAAIVPARQALGLIESDDFVAVQFNPGQAAQVIARTHIEVALHGGTDS